MEISRSEKILRSIIDKTEYTEEPKSRIEGLLIELKDVMADSGKPTSEDDFETEDVEDIMSVIGTDN